MRVRYAGRDLMEEKNKKEHAVSDCDVDTFNLAAQVAKSKMLWTVFAVSIFVG